MLRSLGPLLLLSQTLALVPRDFHVPSIDFTQLSSAPNNNHNFELLDKLQENGIIALQNVPDFARLRHEYLRTAATCAVLAQKKGADFLLHRQLRDSTNRYTVSLESGRQLAQSLDQSAELLVLCPEYVEIHAAFSSAVELAVANVGSALDATQKLHIVVAQGAEVMTARKLLEDSVHLDHFHAYEAAPSMHKVENDSVLDIANMSLELHTDNGVMIAMSAPEYFEVSSDGVMQRKDTQGEDAGLFIQTAKGEIVRPVLQPDELLLMLGSGIEDWVQTSPPLHSVLHGMRYPRSVSVLEGEHGSKVLRSWFGKMILLDSHQVMQNSGLTFGQYANQTIRYLVQQGSEESELFGAVACPPHRRLVASADTCAPKVCSLKSTASSTDLESSCQFTCNHAAAGEAALCSKFCDCQESKSSGTVCWMLCVENVACTGAVICKPALTKQDLATTCPSSASAPTNAPSTAPSSGTAPSTTSQGPSSSSTTPSTSTRTMISPATPASASPASASPASATPASATPASATPASATSASATTVPGSTVSGTSEPGTVELGTPDSGATESGTTESGIVEPSTGSTDSGATESKAPNLGTSDLETSELGTTKSGTTQSDTTQSTTTGPVATTTPASMETNTVSSTTNAGQADSLTTVGDELAPNDALNADEAPAPSGPSSSPGSGSSGASLVPVASFLNVVAVVVATYLCILEG